MKQISSKNIALFIILGIAVFIALIFIGEYKSVMEAFTRLNPEIIIVLISLTFMNILLRFAKWEYFLRKLDIRIPTRSSFLIFLSGITMAITPGKVGEILKSYLLKKSHGIKVRKSIMVVFTERLTDILGVAILSLAGLSAFLIHAYALVFVFILVFILIFILTSEKYFPKLVNLSGRLPIIGRYKKHIIETQEASRKLLTFRSLSISTSMSVFS
ncbi:MAG: flippase-like domain-containing protein, partial [Candidatus Aenigmarchaeota archaeon]|nr:flippase-like domain-containing protein [Candidatus Aenigmarchaeota archaeon]NIP41003.1 flippase-like domain-containing protein [Candidatus Aenigmarchaeota archaeon]NIQ17404.1 flippase-like domain-containing protein [Candidatus Aenigmarchaeota archaeon]